MWVLGIDVCCLMWVVWCALLCVCEFWESSRERDGKREKERKRDSSRNRSYHARTQAEKEIKRNKWAACFAQPRSRPRIRQVPNKTGLTPFVPLIFLYTFSFLSLHWLRFLKKVCTYRHAERNRKNFSLCLALSFSLSLSLTVQRLPRLLVSQ
jgi:hypothetical protein